MYNLLSNLLSGLVFNTSDSANTANATDSSNATNTTDTYGNSLVFLPKTTDQIALDNKLMELAKKLFEFFDSNEELSEKYKKPENGFTGLGKSPNGQRHYYVQSYNVEDSIYANKAFHDFLGYDPSKMILEAIDSRKEIALKRFLSEAKACVSPEQFEVITKYTSELILSLTLAYYPESNSGIREHADFGPVTLHCASSAGLEIRMEVEKSADSTNDSPNYKFVKVEPKPDHYIMQFGGAASVLTGGKLRAATHRVVSHEPNRYFVGLFIDSMGPLVIDNKTIFASGSEYLSTMMKWFNTGLDVEEELYKRINDAK